MTILCGASAHRNGTGLQRWKCAALALAAAHAIGYLVIEKQMLPFDTVMAVCIASTLALQAWGLGAPQDARKG